jgi:chitinase
LPAAAHFRIVAYVASWSMPASIQAGMLTHINFAFAKIDPHGRVSLGQPGAAASLERLLTLRKSNPALRIIISVGGWGADGFSDASLTDASRAVFARSAVELLRQYALDGIDLDWEYPGQGAAGIRYRPEDKQNFTRLVATLRHELDAESVKQRRTASDRLSLTIASADHEYFAHTEMSKLSSSVDWFNVMSYDFFNSLTPTTGHQAGLYRSLTASADARNADAAVRQHLQAGVPAEKLVLGVPFYGRGFAAVAPLHNGLDQRYGRYEGDHSYAELVEKFIGKDGFVRHWDERAQAPYLWNESTRIFISYDDPQSIGIKTRYVAEHHLGGMMFWELSQDRDGELLDVIARGLLQSAATQTAAPRAGGGT